MRAPLILPWKKGSNHKKIANVNINHTRKATGCMHGYLVHDHPDETSEGFGSLARNILFPLIHIATSCNLQLLLSKDSYVFNTARDYSDLDVGQFLSLQESVPTSHNTREVIVNTWSGSHSACGDAGIVAEEIMDDYLRNAVDINNDDSRILVVRLQGALRCMDPTPQVYDWLQERSVDWNDFKGTLRIAAHVRVPEGFAPFYLKADNHVSKLIKALDKLKAIGIEIEECDLDIYTEKQFSTNDEILLKRHYGNACINRGSTETLLDDVKAMAAADVFIPSSSYLSALVGYFTHSVIVIADPSRWQYFQHHRELGCNLIEASSYEHPRRHRRHSI